MYRGAVSSGSASTIGWAVQVPIGKGAGVRARRRLAISAGDGEAARLAIVRAAARTHRRRSARAHSSRTSSRNRGWSRSSCRWLRPRQASPRCLRSLNFPPPRLHRHCPRSLHWQHRHFRQASSMSRRRRLPLRRSCVPRRPRSLPRFRVRRRCCLPRRFRSLRHFRLRRRSCVPRRPRSLPRFRVRRRCPKKLWWFRLLRYGRHCPGCRLRPPRRRPSSRRFRQSRGHLHRSSETIRAGLSSG
jgi:hypothetical protein